MRVTTDRRSLLTAAAGVAEAVARRTTKEVLRCIRLTGTPDGKLVLEATDLDTGVRLEVAGAEVATAGACLLNAAKLCEWLKAARDGEVTVAADDGKGVTLKAPKAKLDQPWLPVDEFPDPIPEVKAKATVQTTAAAFLTAWNRVAFCREKKGSTAFQTTGVVLDVTGAAVTIMATDTKRIGAAEIDGAAVESDGKPFSVTLPPGVAGLLETVAGGEEPVTLTVGTTGFVLSSGRGTVATRIMEGRVPPWRDIMSQTRKRGKYLRFDADPADVAHAVAQAVVTTDDETRRVDAAFRPGSATLTSRAANAGAGEVELDLPGYDGPELALSFDPAYVLDHLKALGDAGPVRVEMAAPEKPVFLSCENCPGWTYFFMPLGG